MPVVRNKKQMDTFIKFKKLEKEYKKKGVPMGTFEQAVHKIALNMKPSELEKAIRNCMVEF